jgi:hypothetical protein
MLDFPLLCDACSLSLSLSLSISLSLPLSGRQSHVWTEKMENVRPLGGKKGRRSRKLDSERSPKPGIRFTGSLLKSTMEA